MKDTKQKRCIFPLKLVLFRIKRKGQRKGLDRVNWKKENERLRNVKGEEEMIESMKEVRQSEKVLCV